MIRVVIAEDSFLIREALRRLLENCPDFDVVASTVDFGSAQQAIDSERPDVVVTDIRMPPTRTDEGLRLADHCRRHYPTTAVLLLSQYIEPSYVSTLLNHGTERRGYLLKERVADENELIQAIQNVAAGGSAIDPKVVQALVQGRAGADDALRRLTPREREVLAGIAAGHTNAAIAEHLVLTGKAVEKHINSIFGKLGLTADAQSTQHPRVRAALLYLSAGIR